jgi:hypothetical protein
LLSFSGPQWSCNLLRFKFKPSSRVYADRGGDDDALAAASWKVTITTVLEN